MSISPGRIGRSWPPRLRGAARRWARELAREAPATPTSSCPCRIPACPPRSAIAQACGLPFELGIIRNHYVGRTFIQPTQAIRESGVRLKHNANRAVVAGKRIVLLDDSIVRGTTSVKIVQMMRDAGAREVHFRISSPPITYPDFYGIDTPERDKLLAARMSLEEMRAYIGVDSLAFLSVDGIYRAMGYPGRDNAAAAVHGPLLHRAITRRRSTDIAGEAAQRAAFAVRGSRARTATLRAFTQAVMARRNR